MNRIINYFRGTARVTVRGVKAERIINTLADREIPFWDGRKENGELTVTVYAKDVKKLKKLFKDVTSKKYGLPRTASWFRKRWWLIFAASFFTVVFWTLSHFIWQIEVYGNETVETTQILRALNEHGVKVGTFGLSINSEALANYMLNDIPQLSWFAVNTSGSRAVVLVRERVPVPKIEDPKVPSVVYADRDGVILEMNVYDGTKMFNVGETVKAGDILVSGVTGSFASGTRTEHAMAYVTARTVYSYSASAPAETLVKDYTGNTKSRYALVIAGKRLDLYSDGKVPFENCDTETSETVLKLPGGGVLPIGIIKIKYSEYETISVVEETNQCAEILKTELSRKLKDDVGEGTVTAAEFNVSEKDGIVTVTLTAECRERIDAVRPMTETEIAEGVKREAEKAPQW